MASNQQIENLRFAYSVMAGVPSEIVSLGHIRANEINGPNTGISDEELLHTHCGSVACVAGLLSAHPHFKAQGLLYSVEAQQIQMHGERVELMDASDELFDYDTIFNAGPCGKYGKLVALERIRVALRKHRAITIQRNMELVDYERTLY